MESAERKYPCKASATASTSPRRLAAPGRRPDFSQRPDQGHLAVGGRGRLGGGGGACAWAAAHDRKHAGAAADDRLALLVERPGKAGARPKAYFQAALHADELPGILVLQHLLTLLAAAEPSLPPPASLPGTRPRPTTPGALRDSGSMPLPVERMPAAVELFSILKSNAAVRELFGDILGGAPRLARTLEPVGQMRDRERIAVREVVALEDEIVLRHQEFRAAAAGRDVEEDRGRGIRERPTADPPYAALGWRTDRRPSATQSGHWKPTDASVMQSGQIERLHRWQRMWLSRSGCR